MNRRIAPLVLAVALLMVAGCTGDDQDDVGERRAPVGRLPGSLLARTENGRGIVVMDPNDGGADPLAMPSGVVLVHAASFAVDGAVVAAVEGPVDHIRVYRLGVDVTPEAIGPSLRGAFTFDIGERLLLAASCHRSGAGRLLDLASPERWRPIPASCGAALSPDDGRVATPFGEDAVRVVRTDGPADATTVFSVARDADASPFLPDGARVSGKLAWSQAGLAFVVGSDDVQALVVLPPDGAPVVRPLGPRAAWIETSLAWQPGGSLLGTAGATTLEGVVGVVDAATGDGDVLGVLREPPFAIAWSPDGRVVLAATLGRWTFVRPDGTWLRSLPYERGRALPMDWRA